MSATARPACDCSQSTGGMSGLTTMSSLPVGGDAQLRQEPRQPSRLGVSTLVRSAEEVHLLLRLAGGDGEAVRRLVGQEGAAAAPALRRQRAGDEAAQSDAGGD